MDDESGFGYSHRHKTRDPTPRSAYMPDKRNRAQMENDSASPPPWSDRLRRFSASREASNDGPRPRLSGLHLPRLADMGPAQPHRYAGDGLDYRRPMASSTNVIDLTLDDTAPAASSSRPEPHRIQRPPQRPPRFDREIIDLDHDNVHVHVQRAADAPQSPEIEFISSRRLDPPRQERRPVDPSEEEIDITSDDELHLESEDDVQIVRSNSLPGRQQHPIMGPRDLIGSRDLNYLMDYMNNETRFRTDRIAARVPSNRNNVLMSDLLRRNRRLNGDGPVAPPRRARNGGGGLHGFLPPGFMNFETVGFDVETGAPPAQPAPKINPPVPAPQGFTRTPEENGGPLACPNCGNELCTGDSDRQKQVWIVKQCGHVYCGQCTFYRAVKKAKASAKGKEKETASSAPPAPSVHKPFKECVVEGCSKKTSPKTSMIQIFL